MRVLVTRDSARSIQEHIRGAILDGRGDVVLDFEGVVGVTPSFLDETLRIVEECIAESDDGRLHVTIEAPPTELSSKFLAVGRGHSLDVSKSKNGSWVISR